MDMNQNEVISYVRKYAKKAGLTFRKNGVKLNSGSLYGLYVRKTGEKVMDNYQLSSAFNDACSGYIESWNGSEFAGIDQDYHNG